LACLAAGALCVLLTSSPVRQSEAYHDFADRRTILGIPNFWNVISNVSFLIAATAGIFSMRRGVFDQTWERRAYGLMNAGVAMTAVGSGYYHLHPNSQTLFWDRLPMTIVFMSVLAITVGERIDLNTGRRLLLPLLVAGTSSVLYWRFSGDLRWYGFVQFIPMLAVPVMLVFFQPRYTHSSASWWMMGFYLLAKGAELFDQQIGNVIATGGHPWKHLTGAVGVGCYVTAIARRRVLSMELIESRAECDSPA
jgi:hypothetical protein